MIKVEKFPEPFKLRNGSKPIYYYIDKNNCYICVSHKTEPNGYFWVKRNGIPQRMHRYIYKIMRGEIPENKLVRHLCDNPRCINPNHLEIGTQKDNMADMKRNKKPRRKRVKLSESAILDILFNTKLTNEQLAVKYQVSVRRIYLIKAKFRAGDYKNAA